jgi:hypothetical protein
VKEQTVKRTLTCISAAALIGTLAIPRVAAAQEKPQLVPLKVQLVISRTAGEKKISSLPYTLWVTANKGAETSLRMGVEVPVATTHFAGKEGAMVPMASYNYRPIGTNIDCSASTVPDGWYNLNITLNESGIRFDSKESSPQSPTGLPSFRSFTSKFSILVKDGQTGQYTSATDPVSGEVLKVDITLNVLK